VPTALHPEAEAEIRGRFAGETTLQRLKMGNSRSARRSSPIPFNRIPGFVVQEQWFVPGFPQMAWPMLEWVLDTKYRHLFDRDRWAEASIIVYLPESTIAPLMVEINAKYKGLKAFSLPSMGEDATRRHIELGVRGAPAEVEPAIADIRRGIHALGGASRVKRCEQLNQTRAAPTSRSRDMTQISAIITSSADHERRRADLDVGKRPRAADAVDDEIVDAERRRDHRGLDQQHEQDSEPDRIVAGLQDQRGGDRDRRDHHRQLFHERAEDQVEQDHRAQHLHGVSWYSRISVPSCWVRPIVWMTTLRKKRADEDRHHQRGRTHRALADSRSIRA
jgi:hypothetical protein